MGGFRGPGLRQTVEGWAAQTRYRFYVPFLQNLAIPYADVFAWLVILGEIGVGVVLLLLGCASRFAALVGAFLCLNDLFASGVPLVSLEQPVVFTVLLVTIYATAAGRALGLDAFLARRSPGWAA